jgi:hypothetical protein
MQNPLVGPPCCAHKGVHASENPRGSQANKLHVWNCWLSAQVQLNRVPVDPQVPLKQAPLQH